MLHQLYKKIKRREEAREIAEYEMVMPMYILTNRFNNHYWNMNQNYRRKHDIKCIYGTPIELTTRIPYGRKCLVLEMNNDTNKIMGIGLITNYPHVKKHKIYGDRNDRYVYKSDKYLPIPSPLDHNAHAEKDFPLAIEVLEELCFYGNGHLKRGNGMKLFPIKYLYRMKNDLDILKILTHVEPFNHT